MAFVTGHLQFYHRVITLERQYRWSKPGAVFPRRFKIQFSSFGKFRTVRAFFRPTSKRGGETPQIPLPSRTPLARSRYIFLKKKKLLNTIAEEMCFRIIDTSDLSAAKKKS